MSSKSNLLQNSTALNSREISSKSQPYEGIDFGTRKSSHPTVALITRGSRLTFEVRELERALMERKLNVAICHPDGFSVQIGANPLIKYNGKEYELPALVLARTGAGTNPRTLILLHEFQRRGIPVVNTPEAIRMVMDKVLTMQRAAAEGIFIPETLVPSPRDKASAAWNGNARMLKLATGSKGRGVVPIDSEPRLRAVLDLIGVVARDRTFLVQDRLGVPGTDIRVFVLGHTAIAAMKRQSKSGEERANRSMGGEVMAFSLTPKIIELSENISRIFAVEIAGIDWLVVGDEFALIEVNGSPGFEGLRLASGIDIAARIADYVVTRISGDLA